MRVYMTVRVRRDAPAEARAFIMHRREVEFIDAVAAGRTFIENGFTVIIEPVEIPAWPQPEVIEAAVEATVVEGTVE